MSKFGNLHACSRQTNHALHFRHAFDSDTMTRSAAHILRRVSTSAAAMTTSDVRTAAVVSTRWDALDVLRGLTSHRKRWILKL